jgi:hypothetical protein
MSRSETSGMGAITGCSASPIVTSTGKLTRPSPARRPVSALARHLSIPWTRRMARSVATEIPDSNQNRVDRLTEGGARDYPAPSMLDSGGRARLLHVAIWLATLFFTAMLFVPLLREVLRRLTEPPPGGPF